MFHEGNTGTKDYLNQFIVNSKKAKRIVADQWSSGHDWQQKTDQKEMQGGTSLAVQWLRLGLAVPGVQVLSLVREQRSHMPHRQKKKRERERRNIVTNSIKTLKMVCIKTS